jgi:hypothetical protein
MRQRATTKLNKLNSGKDLRVLARIRWTNSLDRTR